MMTGVKSAVFYYLNKFLLPVNLNVDPAIVPATALHDFYFLVALCVLACLAGVCFLVQHRHNAVSFGLLCLLMSPLISYVVILLADVAAEHRVYITGLGSRTGRKPHVLLKQCHTPAETIS
jgi:hypothetical protein